MPTYQYRCTECGEDLEAVQKFSDAPLTECPRCGGPLRKLFNAVGVVFKGTGFYRTDSRLGDSTETEKSDGKKDVAAKTNGSGTSEKAAKPAAGSESSASGSGSSDGRTDKVGAAAS
jgi:putative FmdB family regulatory protein